MTTQDNKVVKAPAGRVQRTPVGRGGKLNVQNKQPGFHYRFINASTDPGRVDMFRQAGYVMATEGEVVNGKVLEGSATEINMMGGDKGYLMKIPMEYYQEDQDAKIRDTKQKELQMDKDALRNGLVGKIDRFEKSSS